MVNKSAIRKNFQEITESFIEEKEESQKEMVIDFSEVDRTREYLQQKMKEMEDTSKELQEKVSKEIEKTVTYEFDIEDIILPVMLLIYLVRSRLSGGSKTVLVSATIVNIVQQMQKRKEKIVFSYEDVSSIIDDAFKTLKDVRFQLDHALTDVNEMIQVYKKEFAEFLETEEYKDVIHVLEDTYQMLDQGMEQLDDTEEKIEKCEEENNEKVLKLEKLQG